MNSPIRSYPGEQEKGNVDIKGFLGKLLAKWWLFIIAVVGCLFIALALIKYITPVYLIKAKILVEDQNKGGGGVSQMAILKDMSSLLNHESNVDNEVEILKTRLLAEKVANALALNITYYELNSFKSQEVYKAPFKVEITSPADSITTTSFRISQIMPNAVEVNYKEGDSKKKVSRTVNFGSPIHIKGIGVLKISKNADFDQNPKAYEFKITSIDEAVSSLQKELTISVTNKLVSTIEISLKSAIPAKGEDIIAKLLEEYVNKNTNEKNQIADSTIDFIENRLFLVSKELGDIEGDIQTFKQSNNLADISEQSRLLISNSSDYDKDLSDVKTQLAIIEALEAHLRDGAKLKIVPHLTLPNNSGFNDLVENYNIYLQDRSRQLLTSTEDNPYIKNLDERIGELRKAMLSNLLNTKKSLQIRQNQFQKNINNLGDEIRNIPAHERAYLNLNRQQTLKQELYLYLLKKREETALSKTTTISTSKIIDPPKAEAKPVSPNKLAILLIALIVGLAVPFGFVYIQDVLNDKVQTAEEIERNLSIPILGEIAHAAKDKKQLSDNPNSALAEQFRTLRANLITHNDSSKNCYLVSSSIQGEGKTFIAKNLATAFALIEKSVLLVDLDLRATKLTHELGLHGKSGLVDYLNASEMPLATIIHKSSWHSNISVIPSGTISTNPGEIILQKRVAEVIQLLRTTYDIVILLSPPVELVSDAFLLSKFCSSTLFLVRFNHTSKKHLRAIENYHATNRLDEIAIIWNDFHSAQNVYGAKKKKWFER